MEQFTFARKFKANPLINEKELLLCAYLIKWNPCVSGMTFLYVIRIKRAKHSEFNQDVELVMKTGELNIPTYFILLNGV